MDQFEVRRPRRKPVQDAARSWGFDEPSPFRVGYTPSTRGKFDIYLYGEIESPTQFVGAIDALASASEGDVVVIHLSTNGGSTDATDTFVQAMRECQGRVIVKATGGVHSAGTIILLAANEFTLSENFNSLIHNGSYGLGGKSSDVKAQAAFTEKYMERTARDTYEGFLTPEEIQQMIDGKDFWLGPEEWMERHAKREEFLRAKYGEDESEENSDEGGPEGVDDDEDLF